VESTESDSNERIGASSTNSETGETSEVASPDAGVSPPTIEESYVIPQFGDQPYAFTRIDAVYVWTQGGYQVGRNPDDYPLFLAVRERDVDAWGAFLTPSTFPPHSSDSPETNWPDRCRSSSSHARHSISSTSKGTR